MVELFDLSVCCIKGCDKPARSLGLCVNHYRRNRIYGSPVAMKFHNGQFRGMPAKERFSLQVRKSEIGCWGWSGGRDADGYPAFKGEVDGVIYNRANRYSYALHYGNFPAHLHVCHRCDNPVCTRPHHLFLGTAADNMNDKILKGRHRAAKGEETAMAKLTEEQAAAIRSDARPYTAIAADYGIAPATVGSIKNRDSWRHLDTPIAKAKRVSPRKGVSDKITPEIVREIRTSAMSGRALSARYGISPQSITDIRKRRSWTHVE